MVDKEQYKIFAMDPDPESLRKYLNKNFFVGELLFILRSPLSWIPYPRDLLKLGINKCRSQSG